MRRPVRRVAGLAMGAVLAAWGGLTGCAGNSGHFASGGAPSGMGSTSGNGNGAGAGQLTAGAWDDNLNFDFYSAYLATTERSQVMGLPLVDRATRLVIHAWDGAGHLLPGATITVASGGKTVFQTLTGAEGRALFFPAWAGLSTGAALEVTATAGGANGTATATVGDKTASVTVKGATSPAVSAMDIAFVIDTTGSMGDELRYLASEVTAMADALATRFPGVTQRWGLVLYRDVGMGDEYTVRSFDFTASVSGFQHNLAAQSAGGGGDVPESPELGLKEAATLKWSGGATARLAFWIGDAPHHDGRQGALLQSFAGLGALGVHLYPVSASGTDELLEYSMRTGAEVTGGRYLFLTDDSGIGDSHKKPSIPCYEVTTLSRAVTRMVSMELTGVPVPVPMSEIIRSVGSPMDGKCMGDNGEVILLL